MKSSVSIKAWFKSCWARVMSLWKSTLVLLFVLSPTLFGQSFVRKWSGSLNLRCLSQFEGRFVGYQTSILGKALVCGQNLPSGELRNLFIDLGLYHVLVVSGAHLTWLTAILMFLTSAWSSRISFFILLGFTLMTGAQAPVVRAFLEMGLRPWGWPSWFTQILSVFGCLAFSPNWISSRSLFLSALARMTIRPDLGLFWMTLRIQIVLTPLLLDFSNPSLLGVMGAALLSAAVELVLFPLLLFVFVLPEIAAWVEPVLDWFLGLLTQLHFFFPQPTGAALAWLPYPAWLYWGLATFYLVHLQIQDRRQWFFTWRS